MKRRFGLAILITMALMVGAVGVATVSASKKTGSEGCTPGYWKQSQHFDSWQDYSPNQKFDSVFEDAFGELTLVEVLAQGGGGLNALGRHAVASLLNTASDNVDTAYVSNQTVINLFNGVYPGGDYEALKNIFAGFNELGCPLN